MTKEQIAHDLAVVVAADYISKTSNDGVSYEDIAPSLKTQAIAAAALDVYKKAYEALCLEQGV